MKVDKLSRLLVYMLGHRPDEFGLVPDRDGFVAYKELLQAIHEESGWSYVRQSYINEVLLGKDRPLFQPEEKRIRVLKRLWYLDFDDPSRFLQAQRQGSDYEQIKDSKNAVPKILYMAVRRRAHPVVMEKGLKSREGRHLVLSTEKEMALRIGSRRDQRPVLLEVMAGTAESEGVLFYPFGGLFLCHQIPAKFISGPPVPKEVIERRSGGEMETKNIEAVSLDFTPGTFALDMARDPDRFRKTKGKKRKSWKEEARKIRRRIKR